MRIRHLMLGLICCVGLQTATECAENGVYLGVGAGSASLPGTAHTAETRSGDGLPSRLTINGLSFSSDDVAWFGFAGYKLNSYAAIELGYGKLGEFDGTRLLNGTASLSIDEWAVTARLRYPLVRSLDALWFAGVSRFEYEANGSVLLTFPFPIFPPASRSEIPFASPPDRTGYHWGFGFGWQFNSALGTSLAYRQHKSSVIKAETISLMLTFAL